MSEERQQRTLFEQILDRQDFRGWYCESADGIVAPFDGDEREVEELAAAMDAGAER